MKQTKRKQYYFLCLLTTVLLLFGTAFPVAAAGKEFTVTVSDATAIPGDTVVFNVDIADNPGVMAITVTFHFDPEVLEFDSYIAGIIPKDTLGIHRGYISVVWCGNNNKTANGTLFSMKFRVKDDAPAGKYPVALKNVYPDKYGEKLNGCFADWDRSALSPTGKSGTLTVSYNGKNCNHNYGDWKTVTAPSCTQKGIRSHSCTRCGHTELKETTALGHQYQTVYTVDQVASTSQYGILSRHCTRCDSVTDKIYFLPEEGKINRIPNRVGETVTLSGWITETGEEEIPQPTEKEPPAKEPEKPDPPAKPTAPVSAEDLVQEKKEDLQRENHSDTPSDLPPTETVTVDETIGWWEFLLGKNGENGLFRTLAGVFPKISGALVIMAVIVVMILL